MALHIIADTCISCGACEAECPTGAITAGDDCYVINPDICVECKDHFDTPQCASVCPTDSCVK